MSNRSKLRAAEVAVLEAAVRWAGDKGSVNHDTLEAAVIHYNNLELQMPTRAARHGNSTDTSTQAAVEFDPHVRGLAIEVFSHIYIVWSSGGIGMTCDAIEHAMRRSHQSVSARVNDLMTAGWIYDSGRRMKTRSNRPAVVWSPTTKAVEEWRRR